MSWINTTINLSKWGLKILFIGFIKAMGVGQAERYHCCYSFTVAQINYQFKIKGIYFLW